MTNEKNNILDAAVEAGLAGDPDTKLLPEPPPDLVEDPASSTDEYIATVLDFFSAGGVGKALSVAGCTVQWEIDLLRSIADDDEVEARVRLQAAKTLRTLLTQVLTGEGYIRDYRLTKKIGETGQAELSGRTLQAPPARLQTELLLEQAAKTDQILLDLPGELEDQRVKEGEASQGTDALQGGFVRGASEGEDLDPEFLDDGSDD